MFDTVKNQVESFNQHAVTHL